MSTRHYNVIILGESLASRIAAVALARKGLRVLTFTGPKSSTPPFVFAIPCLDGFLKSLGGLSCFAPPYPFQVLTSRCRVEIGGPQALDEEFRREFPLGHPALERVLGTLRRLGDRLENLFQESGTLPLHGAGSRWRFVRKSARRFFSRGRLRQPLRTLLEQISDADAREFAETLFSGLALATPDDLTVTEGALLWSGASRERGISSPALDSLLHSRYEQFHGESEGIEAIEAAEMDGKRLKGFLLKGGRRCGADTFLLGAPAARSVLPGSPPAVEAAGSSFSAVVPRAAVSPLLAPRVLLAGNPVLRLDFHPADDSLDCRIEAQSLIETAEIDAMRRRLSPVLPFVDCPLTQLPSLRLPDLPAQSRIAGGFPGTARRLREGGALWCSGEAVLPLLGATGEVLLGLSMAHHLTRKP